jgi:hypothetical protein
MQSQNIHDTFGDYEENPPSQYHRLIKSSMVIDSCYNILTGELTKHYDVLVDSNSEVNPHSTLKGRHANKIYAHRFSITGKTWGVYTALYALRNMLIR